MINKLKYTTISDIGVTNLYFYEPDKEEDGLKFCKENLISYLPSKDRKSIYQAKESSFIEVKLNQDLLVNPFDRIFDNNTLKKFEKVNHNEIRFIVEKSKIKGVVHIVDYNNENLQVEFYRAYYKFENNIRSLLIKYRYKNEDFISWVEHQQRVTRDEQTCNFWKRRDESLMPEERFKRKMEIDKRLSSNQFQTFYLKELMLFAIDNKLLENHLIKLESVCSLRNEIAHNKDFTSKTTDDLGG